ncbi:cold-shock protein [bacterium]|nr:cold-shock protein [bacterium]
MPLGTVKRFDKKKGFGFISADEGFDGDIFVHYSDIVGEGYKMLVPGQRVEFDITESDRGHKAVNVTRIE